MISNTDNLLKSFVLVLRQSQGDAGVQCVDCLPLADDIEVLISDRDEYESAWLTAKGKLADTEAERDRLTALVVSQGAQMQRQSEAAEAEREDMFARGFCAGQQALKGVGKLVVVDSPELVTLKAERDRLRRGIEYILDGYGLVGPDYRFPYGEEESDWITDHLIAVMKGESHE